MIFHESCLPADDSYLKYHALFVIFEKSSKILNRCLLQIIGGTLMVKSAHEECENKNLS